MRYSLNEIKCYTIYSNKIKARITNYGCTLLNLWVSRKNDKPIDVLLGYENIEDYFDNPPCFGSCVLPNANRIENARFTLDDKEYTLDKNDGNNNLHSGFEPLHKRLWTLEEQDNTHIRFSITCKDMDMGLPGNREFSITYKIDNNRLRIDYEGRSDADTLFNPTNHSYFNLKGHDNGDILNHKLIINASTYTPCDEHAICHGTIDKVAGTPMDFTKALTIGERINEKFNQLMWGKGYDHNYILNDNCSKPDEGLTIPAATLISPDNELALNIYTSAPCLQLYTGNYLSNNDIGKGNHPYSERSGVAIETQFAPNSINVDSFIKPILNKLEVGESSTIYELITS